MSQNTVRRALSLLDRIATGLVRAFKPVATVDHLSPKNQIDGLRKVPPRMPW